MVNETTRPRLILWDIDHTLIETRGVGGQLARAAFQQVTGTYPEEMADATGKTEPVTLTETLRTHGITPTEEHQRQFAEALPEQYRRHSQQLRTTGRRLPGAHEAITALAQQPGTVQSVLTGNYRAVAAVKLDLFQLDDVLDLDIGAYADDATDRADLVPIAQRRATDKHRHPFTQTNTLIIGDTTHDVTAAHQGGAAIIAVASGNDTTEQLTAAGAETVLPGLADTAAVLRAVEIALHRSHHQG